MAKDNIRQRIAELSDRIKVAASEHEILRLRSEQDKLLDRMTTAVAAAHRP